MVGSNRPLHVEVGSRGAPRTAVLAASLILGCLMCSSHHCALASSSSVSGVYTITNYTTTVSVNDSSTCKFSQLDAINFNFGTPTGEVTWASPYQIEDFSVESPSATITNAECVAVQNGYECSYEFDPITGNATFYVYYVIDGDEDETIETVFSKNEMEWYVVGKTWNEDLNDVNVYIVLDAKFSEEDVTRPADSEMSVEKSTTVIHIYRNEIKANEGLSVFLSFPVLQDCGALPRWAYIVASVTVGTVLCALIACLLINCCRGDPDEGYEGGYGMSGAIAADTSPKTNNDAFVGSVGGGGSMAASDAHNSYSGVVPAPIVSGGGGDVVVTDANAFKASYQSGAAIGSPGNANYSMGSASYVDAGASNMYSVGSTAYVEDIDMPQSQSVMVSHVEVSPLQAPAADYAVEAELDSIMSDLM